MNNFRWTKDDETDWKNQIENLFSKTFETELAKYSPLELGDNLFRVFKDTEIAAVKLVAPRAIRKWASKETSAKWQEIIKDEEMLLEVRNIGKSIANTLRPLAGNKFALIVAKLLNSAFKENKLSLICQTQGKEKKQLSENLILKDETASSGIRDFKPDIDIVVSKVFSNNRIPIAIISAKTTLAERVMQTITWKRYIDQLPDAFSKMKFYLVTLWETFESGTNRERVQELDGVFVCNKNIQSYGKIKPFSMIIDELKKIK